MEDMAYNSSFSGRYPCLPMGTYKEFMIMIPVRLGRDSQKVHDDETIHLTITRYNKKIGSGVSRSGVFV